MVIYGGMRWRIPYITVTVVMDGMGVVATVQEMATFYLRHYLTISRFSLQRDGGVRLWLRVATLAGSAGAHGKGIN